MCTYFFLLITLLTVSARNINNIIIFDDESVFLDTTDDEPAQQDVVSEEIEGFESTRQSNQCEEKAEAETKMDVYNEEGCPPETERDGDMCIPTGKLKLNKTELYYERFRNIPKSFNVGSTRANCPAGRVRFGDRCVPISKLKLIKTMELYREKFDRKLADTAPIKSKKQCGVKKNSQATPLGVFRGKCPTGHIRVGNACVKIHQ